MMACFWISSNHSWTTSIPGSLLVGVVSSLVATFIFLLLAEIARRIIIPWFRQQVYSGVRVDGVWRWEISATPAIPATPETPAIEATPKHELRFQFVQAGDRLSGVHTLVSASADGKITVSNYSITGFVADARVIGYVRPMDKQSTTYTSFYLKFRDTVHGAQLYGRLTADTITGELISPDVCMERVPS